jgi:hypothetical protein
MSGTILLEWYWKYSRATARAEVAIREVARRRRGAVNCRLHVSANDYVTGWHKKIDREPECRSARHDAFVAYHRCVQTSQEARQSKQWQRDTLRG